MFIETFFLRYTSFKPYDNRSLSSCGSINLIKGNNESDYKKNISKL